MQTKIILNAIAIMISGFSVFSQPNLFQVQVKGEDDWGYVNLKGEVVIKPQFKVCFPFGEEGVALVLIKKKWAIINTKGEVVTAAVDPIKPQANPWSGVVDDFSDGYLVVTENNRWGALDASGKIAIQIKYDRLTNFEDGYALAQLNGKFFVVSKSGAEAPVQASGINAIKHFSEGLGIIEAQGLWGFVDGSGKTIITPKYEGVGYFSGRLAWARSKGVIGFINPQGEWVIQPQFSAVRDFDKESGLAMVEKGGQWGYADTSGNFKRFNETEKPFIFSDGLAIGRKNGKVGFLNNKGEWAIPPEFDVAREFNNGYAPVQVNNKWGLMDKTGNWVITPTFPHMRDEPMLN